MTRSASSSLGRRADRPRTARPRRRAADRRRRRRPRRRRCRPAPPAATRRAPCPRDPSTLTSSTGRHGLADCAVGQCGLVDHRHVGHVDRRRAEVGWRTESLGLRGEQLRAVSSGRGVRKRSKAMSLLTQMVSAPKRRAIGSDGRRVEGVRLGAIVEGVEQIHRRGGAEWQEVAGDQRLGRQARQWRIDGVAPAVRAELGARELHDPVLHRPGVQRSRRLAPCRRRVLVADEGRVDEAADRRAPAG